MLDVRHLSAAYGPHPALQDVSLTVGKGEIVVILGANGAGKSTLLRAIAGICEGHVEGDVTLNGQPLRGLAPDRIVEAGVALVPEGRGIFGDLTVRENLSLGAYAARARGDERGNLDRVLSLFPKLRERQGQTARTMSGGEQQMVAVGRAMMSNPEILMLDEPSLGLSPLLCKDLFQSLRGVKDAGIGILLVEQNAKQSLAIADRGYLLENTRIVHEDSAARLIRDPAVQKAYLGAGGKAAPAAKPGARPAAGSAPAESPPPPPVQARAQPRRTADQQIGLDIDDLVAGAAKTSAAPRARPSTGQPRSRPAGAPPLPRDPRIEQMAREIERAAEQARRAVAAPAKPATPAPAPPDPGPPPVIEIYRRPRVEVYRRAPDGGFDRD